MTGLVSSLSEMLGVARKDHEICFKYDNSLCRNIPLLSPRPPLLVSDGPVNRLQFLLNIEILMSPTAAWHLLHLPAVSNLTSSLQDSMCLVKSVKTARLV